MSDDFTQTMASIGSLNQTIQHADAKVTVLLALHSGPASVVVMSDGGAAMALLWEPFPLGAVMWLYCALLVTCFVRSTCLLLAALRPTVVNGAFSRFSFPSLAVALQPPEDHDAATLRREASETIGILAAIARDKHNRVRHSVGWVLTTLILTLGWWLLGTAGPSSGW